MTLFLVVLVFLILAEQFHENDPQCNCPDHCPLHKDLKGTPRD